MFLINGEGGRIPNVIKGERSNVPNKQGGLTESGRPTE